MYKAKLLGEDIRITNDVYENLLERFNPANLDYTGAVRIECGACEKYNNNHHCGNCPFKVFETSNRDSLAGCAILMRRILNNNGKYFTLYVSSSMVKAKTDAQVEQLRVLYGAILFLFEKVK